MEESEKKSMREDLSANERVLEVQAEIVKIEKERLESTTPERAEELKNKVKLLVEEERLILEKRYKNQKEIKEAENEVENAIENTEKVLSKDELRYLVKEEVQEEDKYTKEEKKSQIKEEIKEELRKEQKKGWFETWWGKLIVVIVGATILYLLGIK